MGGMCSSEDVPEIIAAVRNDDEEGVKALLSSGSDVNAADEAQWTALHVACAFHGHYLEHEDPDRFLARVNIVRMLIDAGADLNAVTRVGSTPLHETAFNDFEDAAEMLLKAGCKADELNMGGRSPLHMACEQGALTIATWLLEKGADGNRADRDGETPFLNASDSCKKLLNAKGFEGDMSTTNESRDKAFLDNLDDRGGTSAAAEQANATRQGALKKDAESEKSGMLMVKVEKANDEYNFYVQRAKYLKDCDALGGNDVYVVVSIGKEDLAHPEIPPEMQHQRTTVIKDGGADPVWNRGEGEKLTFLDVPEDFEDIYFRCYDEDVGGEMNHDLIGIHKMSIAKVKMLRGDGKSDFVWEADVQLRTNKEEEQSLPPVTSDRYRSADELDEMGNPLAGGVAAT